MSLPYESILLRLQGGEMRQLETLLNLRVVCLHVVMYLIKVYLNVQSMRFERKYSACYCSHEVVARLIRIRLGPVGDSKL